MLRIAKFASLSLVLIFGIFAFIPFATTRDKSQIVLISPLPKTALAQTISPSVTFSQLVNENIKFFPTPTPTVVVPKINKPVNILLLGLDGRKGDKNPRCDAIHMVSFDPEKGKILITTVPRGTLVTIPGIERQSRYLGNSCHLVGIDFAVLQIEKITGIHSDYLVKVNFSSTLGVMRLLDLPTTPTLQFLRSRRYPRGDYQRSHNQALFIKDMITTRLSQFAQLPKPIQYLAFKMVETDIDFEKAISLLHQILDSDVYKDPNRIEVATKPDLSFSVKEIHFPDEEFLDESVWQNAREFKDYQNNLARYLEDLLARAERLQQANKISQAFQLINTPFNQQLWLQLEDEEKRNPLHFGMLKLFVLTSPQQSNLTSLLLDFITEMESVNQNGLKQAAEELLRTIEI